MSLIDIDEPPPVKPLDSANMSDVEEAVWKFWARRGSIRRLSSRYAFNGEGHVVHIERKCTTTSQKPNHRQATLLAKS